VVVVVGVLLTLVAAACASESDADPTAASTTTEALEPQRGGQLVYATDSDVDGWNPTSSAWAPRAHTVARAIFDPITIIDENGDWAPYLVESIVPNDTFTVWTFHLRDGVTFHNGEVLDAEAFKGNLDAIVNGLVSSQAFVAASPVTVREVDDMTVEVEVAEPWTQFPSVLADQPGYVMAPAMIEAGGEGAQEPVGTGPFVFDEWIRDSHIRLTRNPEYWQEGLPYLDEVEFRPVTDSSNLIPALEASDIGAAISVAGSIVSQVPEIEAAGDLRVSRDDGTKAEGVIMFNLDTEIGGDLRVRQALAQAIDKQSLVDTVFAGQFTIADQPYEPDEPWYNDQLDGLGYDPEAARALVEDYEAENGELVINMKTVLGPDFLALLQLVQQQLDAVGIEMTIEGEEVVAFTQSFIAGDFDVILIGTFFRTADPDNEHHFMHSDNADPEDLINLNFPRHRSDAVDAALDAARASNDPAERKGHYDTIWQTFADDLPYLFLYHLDSVALSRPEVHGLGSWEAPDGSQIPSVNGSAQWVTRAWVEQ
jgi:peptide/nickel transport system substrate-binding protein